MSESSVEITVDDVTAAVGSAQPSADTAFSRRVTTLTFGGSQPSGRFGNLRGGAKSSGIQVEVDPSPVPGGPLEWSTQVRFPRGSDIEASLQRTGAAWPVWWAVGEGEMTVLVERARLLGFVGFADPELALPWFVRLNAAFTDTDPSMPVRVSASVRAPLDHRIDGVEDIGRLATDSMHSDQLKLQAYEEWKIRAASEGYHPGPD